MNFFKITILPLIFLSQSALAASWGKGTTCTQPGDWDDTLCNSQPLAERCDTLQAAKTTAQAFCAPTACPPAIGGGCMGWLGSNNWWPISVDSVQYRCACGCSAEETVFETTNGTTTARDLVELQKAGHLDGVQIRSSTKFEDIPSEFFAIQDVVSGPERELANVFVLVSGRSIVLSNAHPVVAKVSPEAPEIMKTARSVKVGEYFIDSNGNIDEVREIRKEPYGGKMVNFKVKSPSRIVYANEFKTGDHAWQNYLSRAEGELLTVGDIIAAIEKSPERFQK